MSRNTIVVMAVLCGGALLTLVGVSVALQTAAFVWAVSRPDRQPHLADVLEDYVDGQIESGLGDLRLDMDDPLLEQRKILLGHTVNARSAKHVATKLMYLDAVDGAEPIDLFISTQGGYTDSAFTIIDTMRMIEAPVNTWALGGCYSAGALILSAGTGVRYASERAIIMIHANLEDSDGAYTYGRLERARYEGLWRESADLPEEWFPMTDDGTYYLGPQEALDLSIVDAIAPAGHDAAKQAAAL